MSLAGLREETAEKRRGKKKGKKKMLLEFAQRSSAFLATWTTGKSDSHISQRRGLSFNRHRSAIALALLIIVLTPVTEDYPKPV